MIETKIFITLPHFHNSWFFLEVIYSDGYILMRFVTLDTRYSLFSVWLPIAQMFKKYTEVVTINPAVTTLLPHSDLCCYISPSFLFYFLPFSFLLSTPPSFYLFLLVVGWLLGFNGISTFVGYLTDNPFLYK